MWKLRPRRSLRPRVGETAYAAAPKRLRRAAVGHGQDDSMGSESTNEGSSAVTAHVTSQSEASSIPPPPVQTGSSDLRVMPQPVEDLLESPAELALDAAFADKRAMLELSGYAAEGNLRHPLANFWSRRSATRAAEPFPLGFDTDNPSKTTPTPMENSVDTARFLGMSLPAHQAAQIGPHDATLPLEIQDYLAKQTPYEVAAPLPVPSTSKVSQDLAAIAPFGLGEDDSPPAPISRRHLGPILGIQAADFLSYHETHARWRRALIELRERGEMDQARLEALTKAAREIQQSHRGPITLSMGEPLIFENLIGSEDSLVTSQSDGRRETALEELERVKQTQLHLQITEVLKQAIHAKSPLVGLLDNIFRPGYGLHVVVVSDDGTRLEETVKAPSAEYGGETAPQRAQRIHDAFLGARRALLEHESEVIDAMGPLQAHTALPSWNKDDLSSNGRYRQRARMLQYRLLFLYARHEALARAALADVTLDAESRALLRRTVERAYLRTPTANDEARLLDAIQRPSESAHLSNVQHRWDDAAAARILRANLTGVLSLRDRHNERHYRSPAAIQLLSTVDWRRHKHKKHRKKKREKRGATQRAITERRARKERMRHAEVIKGRK